MLRGTFQCPPSQLSNLLPLALFRKLGIDAAQQGGELGLDQRVAGGQGQGLPIGLFSIVEVAPRIAPPFQPISLLDQPRDLRREVPPMGAPPPTAHSPPEHDDQSHRCGDPGPARQAAWRFHAAREAVTVGGTLTLLSDPPGGMVAAVTRLGGSLQFVRT